MKLYTVVRQIIACIQTWLFERLAKLEIHLSLKLCRYQVDQSATLLKVIISSSYK